MKKKYPGLSRVVNFYGHFKWIFLRTIFTISQLIREGQEDPLLFVRFIFIRIEFIIFP